MANASRSEKTPDAGLTSEPARTAGAAAEVIRDMTKRIADKSHQAVRLSLNAVAGAQVPLVDAGYEQSRRMVEAAARMTDIGHDGAQRTAEDLQAMIGSYYSLGRGMQRYQHAYLDLLSRSMDSVARKRQEMSKVHSTVDFAEIQRDIYLDSVNSMFAGCMTLLQIAAQISQDAMLPLQERSTLRKAAAE